MRGIPSYTVTEKSGHFCLICEFFWNFTNLGLAGSSFPRSPTFPFGEGGPPKVVDEVRRMGQNILMGQRYHLIRHALRARHLPQRGRSENERTTTPLPPFKAILQKQKRPKALSALGRFSYFGQPTIDYRSAICVSDRSSPSCGKRPARHRPRPAYPAADP